MNTLLVHVTAEDIRLGERQSADSCPIARAVRREGISDVTIGDEYHDVGDVLYAPSKAVRSWIERFDDGGVSSVEPITLRYRFGDGDEDGTADVWTGPGAVMCALCGEEDCPPSQLVLPELVKAA